MIGPVKAPAVPPTGCAASAHRAKPLRVICCVRFIPEQPDEQWRCIEISPHCRGLQSVVHWQELPHFDEENAIPGPCPQCIPKFGKFLIFSSYYATQKLSPKKS
jgi:hypothetical protein